MNLNSAALRLMAAKGLTLDDVAEIVAANEARLDTTAAERQRRCRNKKANGHAVTVTRDMGSPNESILTPPVPLTNSDELAFSADEPNYSLKPEHVVEAWNATAERLGLKAVRKFTPERRRKLLTRIRQNSIEDFTEAIASIERSPFLRGENDRGWRADFDWMLEPKNFTKLTEGTYER